MLPFAGLKRDLRLALRSLQSHRTFFLGSATVLATGLAASWVMFSIVNALLLRPLPVTDQGSLVRIWKNDPSRGYPHFPLTYPEYLEWRRAAQQFEGLAALWAWGGVDAVLETPSSSERVHLNVVSENYFDVLGVSAAYGRTLEPGDNEQTTLPPVVLSFEFWRRRLGEDRSLVGRTIPLVQRKLERFRVVGILPRGFDLADGADAWAPALAVYPEWRSGSGCECDLIGRLRSGVSLKQGRDELQSIHARTVSERPDEYGSMEVVAQSLLSTIVGDAGVAAVFLFGAVLILLALSVVNLAGLFFIRTVRRERETALLHAMGADSRELLRPLILEAILITFSGSLAGVILAYAGLRAVVHLGSAEIPRLVVSLDWRIGTYTILAAVACGIGFSLIPAVRSSKGDFLQALRGRSWKSSDLRLMHAVILAEIALAFAVLYGSTLLVRTLDRQERIPRGVDAAGLLNLPVQLPEARYPTPLSKLRFFETAADEVRAIPGVEAVTTMMVRPGTGDAGAGAPLAFEGQTELEASSNPYTSFETVDDNYFETLAIPLESGRVFTRADRLDSEPVVIVSESIARTYWPGSDPIDKTVMMEGSRRYRVVGVVGDTRFRELRRAWHSVYFPVRQNPFSDEPVLHPFLVPRYLVARTSGDVAQVANAIETRVRALEPQVLMDDVTSMQALFDRELGQARFNALVASVFAFLALALVAVGLYAIVSAYVTYRAREVALRLAVGATPAQIGRLILARVLRLTALGVAAGGIVAAGSSRFVESQLYGVSRFDTISLGTVLTLLVVTMLAATSVPTSRAALSDPAAVLRQE